MKEFVAQFLDGSMTLSRDSELMINSRIAQIDHLIDARIRLIVDVDPALKDQRARSEMKFH